MLGGAPVARSMDSSAIGSYFSMGSGFHFWETVYPLLLKRPVSITKQNAATIQTKRCHDSSWISLIALYFVKLRTAELHAIERTPQGFGIRIACRNCR
jgi:hypothetical protein